ncbi:MAG TPA: hypothetical protein VIC57_15330 [Candidatus Dormibacteraeota bacterium]|jgi:hypothetical protein
MTDELLPDPSAPFGECLARRLRGDHVVWRPTPGAGGAIVVNGLAALSPGESPAHRDRVHGQVPRRAPRAARAGPRPPGPLANADPMRHRISSSLTG